MQQQLQPVNLIDVDSLKYHKKLKCMFYIFKLAGKTQKMAIASEQQSYKYDIYHMVGNSVSRKVSFFLFFT